MKLKTILLVIGLSALSGMAYGTGEYPGHGTHWAYQGDVGPDRWSTLKPEFSACSGKN
jgi:carbonic anhydrase